MRWCRVIVLVSLIAVGIGIALGVWWKREIDRFNGQAAYYNCLYNSQHDFGVQLNTHIEYQPIRFNWHQIEQRSPDGRYLAGAYYEPGEADAAIYFVDDLLWNRRAQLPGPGNWAWSPDGRWLYRNWLETSPATWHIQVLTPQGNIKFEDVFDYRSSHILSDIHFSPDSRYFAYWVYDVTSLIVNVTSTDYFSRYGYSFPEWRGVDGYEANMAYWLPAGHKLIIKSGGPQFAAIDQDQEQLWILDLDKRAQVDTIGQTPDGRYIYAVSTDEHGDHLLTQVFLLENERVTRASEINNFRPLSAAQPDRQPNRVLYAAQHDDTINHSELWRLDLETGLHEPLPLPLYHDLVITRHNKYVLVRREGSTELVEMRDADGSNPVTLLSFENIDFDAGLSCHNWSDDWLIICQWPSPPVSQYVFTYDGDARYFSPQELTRNHVSLLRSENGAIVVDILEKTTGMIHAIDGIANSIQWMRGGYVYRAELYESVDQSEWFILFGDRLFQYSLRDGSVELLYEHVDRTELAPDGKRLAIYIREPDSLTNEIVVRELDGSKSWRLGTFYPSETPYDWTQCGGILAQWRDDRAAIRLN